MMRGEPLRARQLGGALLVGAALLTGVARAEPVRIERDGDVPLLAHWYPAPGATEARPAVIALHGCGGLYRRDGNTLDARYPEYVEHLHQAGYHVLLPDSLGSRSSGPICTAKRGERSITVETRRADVATAVTWLAARPEVDSRRIALLGWSHGAGTTLNAINGLRTDSPKPLAGAVVFYPGCRAALAQTFRLDMPLLMLLGEKDDWTPAAPCVQMADRIRAKQPGADLAVRVYADSGHGFDSTRPVRLRADVSTGVDSRGVHVGGNPAAMVAARQEMDAFFARIFR
jgi:dienelactone hydrolase